VIVQFSVFIGFLVSEIVAVSPACHALTPDGRVCRMLGHPT